MLAQTDVFSFRPGVWDQGIWLGDTTPPAPRSAHGAPGREHPRARPRAWGLGFRVWG